MHCSFLIQSIFFRGNEAPTATPCEEIEHAVMIAPVSRVSPIFHIHAHVQTRARIGFRQVRLIRKGSRWISLRLESSHHPREESISGAFHLAPRRQVRLLRSILFHISWPQCVFPPGVFPDHKHRSITPVAAAVGAGGGVFMIQRSCGAEL